MTDLNLPGAIFEDAATIHYRRGFRAARLVVHQSILRQAGQRKRLRMRLCAWALNWGRSVNQVKALYSQMQADGLCTWTIEGDGKRDDFATFTWSDSFVVEHELDALAEAEIAALKERSYDSGYQAGLRARPREKNGSQETTAEPQVSHAAPTPLPQINHKRTTNGTTPHAGAKPEPESVPVPESAGLYKIPEPDSPESVPEPEPEAPPAAQPRPDVPLSVVEQFERLGMSRERAQSRYQELEKQGAGRGQDALDALAYRQEVGVVKSKIGFIVDFIKHERPVPEEVLRRREEAARVQDKPKVRYVVRQEPPPAMPVSGKYANWAGRMQTLTSDTPAEASETGLTRAIDPEKAAAWNAQVEEMLESGGVST